MAFDPSQYTSEQLRAISPSEFVSIVKSLKDKEIKELMAGERRQDILDAIFERMPELYKGKEGASRSVTHWTVTGDRGGASDDYTVVFDGAQCTTCKGHDGEPRASLTMGPVEFCKVVTKDANPVMLVMRGKVKASGDIGYAAKIADFFDLPA